MQKTMTNLDRVGGINTLRQIMTDFYKKIFNDDMIAYLFYEQELPRLVDREVEWTARLLGGTHIKYQGKSLQQAHHKHPIRRGHFFRRHQLLVDTLSQYDIPHDIEEMWLAHSLSLIHVILGRAQHDTRCEMTAQNTQSSSHTTTPGLWISTKN